MVVSHIRPKKIKPGDICWITIEYKGHEVAVMVQVLSLVKSSHVEVCLVASDNTVLVLEEKELFIRQHG